MKYKEEEFYDKVANKFGGYGFNKKVPKFKTEYLNGIPEAIFKEKILELASSNKVVLDAGCGDGVFSFNLAKYFNKIIGIDVSKGLLNIFKKKQKALNIYNCEFSHQDASNTSFENDFFDVIFSRRGPTEYKEFFRLLKPGGSMCIITIGEKDTKSLIKIFGRGQNYDQAGVSKLKRDLNRLKNIGFKVVFKEEYFYNEYYDSYDDLDLFLQGVPIFRDFDSIKDEKFLREYVKKNTSNKGIKLERHRYVILANKPK